jgi:hypothetical protein
MIIITVNFNSLLVNWYNNRLLLQIKQPSLIPNSINEVMNLETIMFHLLLESILSEFEYYQAIFSFSYLQ